MNKIYRLIWSEVTRTWVAVAEIFTIHGKRSRGVAGQESAQGGICYPGRLRKLAWFILLQFLIDPLALAAAPAPQELPTGGQVVSGQAAISQSAATMNIQQSSSSAVVNWNSFNVGSQAQVNIYQPSSSSALLNRVTGGSPSQIFGQIHANGQVYLSNPNGVFFAPGASVQAGSFVASSMDINAADFMAGKRTLNRNGSTASVDNQGNITVADGGYVALLAPEVRNEGVIIANMGTVALASGEAVQLQLNASNQLVNLLVTPSAVQALVENRHAIVAQGGQILLTASALSQLQGSVIQNDGQLDASSLTSVGGHIVLQGDEITVGGSSQISADGA
ncbi:MAG: filamentous hemagglutinin N-terminal domain-containing protein, partial [Enterobacteriaceae bacterium]